MLGYGSMVKRRARFGQNDHPYVVDVIPYFRIYIHISDYGHCGIGSGLMRVIFQVTKDQNPGYPYHYDHVECKEGGSGYFPCDY